jgi:crotonobetainyl-CoA:carnitine CoA-transferase CaiB-like acyl-CoA transferase
MSGPLDGLRILDLSGIISGGYATMQPADFGADVVTVEHTEEVLREELGLSRGELAALRERDVV